MDEKRQEVVRRRKDVKNNRYVWQRKEGDGETKKTNEGQTRQRLESTLVNQSLALLFKQGLPFQVQ